jgi:hypothetical protein
MLIDIETDSTSYQLNLDLDMALSDESLHSDMCDLPRKIARYAQIMGECKAHAANMKKRMEQAEARADKAIRNQAIIDKERTTEPSIVKSLSLDEAVSAARTEYYKADAQFTMVEGCYRALRDKSSIAIALCYFQKDEMKLMGVGD